MLKRNFRCSLSDFILLKLNSFIFYLIIFEKQCNTSLLNYSDYFYSNITLWENGVLQLVSEQVGPSGQLVESCRA